MFCVLWPPLCCKLRGLLVRGLEPRLRKSGTRKFLGGPDHWPKIIKWQGMKLLTLFVGCLCQLGGTEVRCEEEAGSQNACTYVFKRRFFSETNKKTNKKTPTQDMKNTTYPFRFVAVTNSRKWMDCFGFIFQNLRCASSRVCYINNFRRTLRNLLYQFMKKDFLLPAALSNKGIVASQKRHSALSFDIQSNR